MDSRWRCMAVATRALATVECPVPEGAAPASIAAQGAEVRLRYLSKLLSEEGAAARRWTFAWGGTYALLGLAQLGVLPLFDKPEWPDWYWGAASSLVGVAFSVLDPLEVLHEGDGFARRAAAAGDDDTCRLLAEGERLLREGAEHEADGRSWLIHGGNVLFNAGIGLVLGLGYGRWVSGLINFAVGALIGELTIFTSPNQLIAGWKQYRGAGGGTPVSVRVVPLGPGLGLVVSF